MTRQNKNPRPGLQAGIRGQNKVPFAGTGKRYYTAKFTQNHHQTPEAFYRRQFPGLRARNGWALVKCCFHDDRQPSLSINLVEGHFKCHACGAKGGGIVDFRMKQTGLPFRDVVRELEGWR